MDDLFNWTPPPRKPVRPVLPPGDDADNYDISNIPDDVVHLFEHLALMAAKRRTYYSARDISSRMRWYYDFEQGENDFKFNDHWTPDLARWFLASHPEQEGFFELRRRSKLADAAA